MNGLRRSIGFFLFCFVDTVIMGYEIKRAAKAA